MKLKLKTFLLVGISSFILMIVQVLYLSPMLLKEATALDHEYAIQTLQQTRNKLLSEMDKLNSLNRDWANWDDSYEFLSDNNQDFPKRNVGNLTFENNRIAFMVFVNTENNLVYQKGYDLKLRAPVHLTIEFHKVFLPLIENKELISDTFFIKTEYGIAMVSIESVLRSGGKGTPVGKLIMGRYISEDSMAELGEELSLNLSFRPIEETHSELFTVKNINEHRMTGSWVIKDYSNRFAYEISVDMLRNFYVQKKETLYQITFYFLLTSVIFLLLIIVLLNYFILNPIRDLSLQLNEIQKNKDLRGRVKRKFKSKDELSILENSINETLIALEEKHTRITELAYHDQLTKLPNRYLFFHEFENRSQQNQDFVIIFLDLDGFKRVNDTFGHEIGDLLLKRVSSRINIKIAENQGLLARYAGDEFVILLNMTDRATLELVAKSLLMEVKKEYQLATYRTVVTASIGISMYPQDGVTLGELLRNADAAMYEAKRKGRNQYYFFQDLASSSEYKIQLELENDLKYAIENNELELYYQPIISCMDKNIVGVEALLRWKHPQKGMIPPIKFIPIAEENGLMPEIGRWVLVESLKQGEKWNKLGYRNLILSINVSKSQMNDGKFIDLLDHLLSIYQLNSSNIQFEITESDVNHYLQEVREFLKEIKERGIQIALDDFGVGTSSLVYLKELPIDVIKIDRSFIMNITTEPADQILLEGIFDIAKGLHLDLIVEGIENEEQYEYVCSHIDAKLQGFHFSRPLPVQQFEKEFLRLD